MKLFRVPYCYVVLLLSLLVFALAPLSQASAASGLVTKGDVEAILHSAWSGGALLFHAHPVPVQENFPRAGITPLSTNNGTHYCVDDWHVLRLAYFNGVDNVFFFTKEQAIADLAATTVTLTLDGVTLPATRTPIIMFNTAITRSAGAPGPFLVFQTGSIFSPTALSVGDHTAGVFGNDPVFGPFSDSSTFTVDPSGTGVCLQG